MKLEKNKNLHGGHIGDASVALYVDALLREDLSPLTEEVRDHVEECPECKDKILDLFLFMRNSDSAGEIPVREKVMDMPVRHKPPFHARRAAAAFFLFALILIAYFLIYKPGFLSKEHPLVIHDDTDRQVMSRGDTEPAGHPAVNEKGETKETPTQKNGKTSHSKLPPAGFRVNPNLENMIGSQSRSAVVRVRSPRNNSNPDGDILFAWEETHYKPLQLKILNNKNEALFEYRIENNRIVFNEKLAPGLYYWKLESKTDLLYVGKFFIK